MPRSREDAILAAGIEADWADHFFPGEAAGPARFLEASEGAPQFPVISPFPAAAAGFIAGQLVAAGIRPESVLEVGAGCGRFAFELLGRVPSISRAMVMEPMPAKAAFLRWLFALDHGDRREWPFRAGGEVRTVPFAPPPALRREPPPAVEVHAATLEGLGPQLARNDTPYALVTCLNVLDHVASPQSFADLLAEVTSPGNHLAISSPLDWHRDFTPPERWKSRLADFFPVARWEPVAAANLPFLYRPALRTVVLFQSEILLLRRA